MRSLFATIYASLIFTALVLLKCEANSITQLDDQHGVSDPPSGFDSKPLSMSNSSINNASQTANSNSANGDPKPDRATFLQYFKIQTYTKQNLEMVSLSLLFIHLHGNSPTKC